MSTRAAIRIRDPQDELWFYTHSNGEPVSPFLPEDPDQQPQGVMPDLITLRNWLTQGRIRNNVQQASGWLVRLGVLRLLDHQLTCFQNPEEPNAPAQRPLNVTSDSWLQPAHPSLPLSWKASHYEPCPRHVALLDYRYAYTLDLDPPQITVHRPGDPDLRP